MELSHAITLQNVAPLLDKPVHIEIKAQNSVDGILDNADRSKLTLKTADRNREIPLGSITSIREITDSGHISLLNELIQNRERQSDKP